MPPEHLANAISWNSICFQAATIIGPALGGLLYGWTGGASAVYALCAGLTVLATLCLSAMEVRTGQLERRAVPVEQLLAGIRYVWQQKTILGSISLADMVSVVVRMTLVQLATPASMRGRVSAVNLVFIGATNELGEFESGVTAAWLGAVPAVVAGGAGTLLVVALWAWLFPQLRRINRIEDAAVKEEAPVQASGASPPAHPRSSSTTAIR